MYEFSDLVMVVGLVAGLFALLAMFAIAAGLSLILKEAQRSIALARGTSELSRAQLELLEDELRDSPEAARAAKDALEAFQKAQDDVPRPAATSPAAGFGASFLSLPDAPGPRRPAERPFQRAKCRFCAKVRAALGMR
jgi:hypothetical protein